MDPILTDPMDSYTNAYAAYNQEVSLFDFGEVIVMKNYKQNDHVRIVSGGSCCHIKYVGTGILTASIQGNKNDPPTSSLILRTIRELSINHIKGVLLIIQATSGDLLSFGLAVERADNDDLRVAFIKVADDSRNNEYPKSERRGLSGVVLVNKIAGALAMANKTMPDIYDYCIKVVDNLASIGTNVKNLLIDSRECMYCDKCAMQLEGAEKKTFLNKLTTMDILDNTVRTLIKEISENESLNLKPKDNIVVLVNNLDALNQNEEWVFFRHCVKYLNIIDLVVVKFYIGNFLQFNYDLDLTITILKVFDKNVIELLDAPCDVKVWKPVLQNKPIEISNNLIPGSLRRKCRLSLPIKGPKLNDRAANVVLLCLQFACEALISCEKMLNTMDAEKGDGDTGTRLRIMAEVLKKRSCSKKLNITCPFTFFLTLSKVLENAVGGTMGCLYSIIFEAAARTFGTLPDNEEITAEIWVKALENTCEVIKKYGNVERGDNTMLDPLETCAITLRENLIEGKYIYSFDMGVNRAQEVAQNTKRFGSKLPDPGAHAVGIWLRAICEAVKLRCME